MFEEGNDKSIITPKLMKVEEKEDRISELPDCLLLEILHRLPCTRSAIITGTLSKRWRNLWTSLPTLRFCFTQSLDERPLSDFVSFVDKTLAQCHQSRLRDFVVHTTYNTQFESQVNNWIRYAISCKVELLVLRLFGEHLALSLNEDFYINSCLTDLILSCRTFNPTGAISWNKLRSLWISDGNLDEDLIENILNGSPLLEYLGLEDCYGYRRLDITSKNVKSLEVFGYWDPSDELEFSNLIEINAPNILSLTIHGDLLVRKFLLLNVSSLVDAYLDFPEGVFCDETIEEEEVEEEMLKGFIQRLHHVKELKYGEHCLKVIKRLEANGFSVPSNVKLLDVTSLFI